MVLDADVLTERRRLRRRLAAWRALAVVAVAAAVLVLGELLVRPVMPGWGGGDYIARIAIDGVITEDHLRDERLAELAEDTAARAVVVHIASPGGTTYGAETLYHALRRVAEGRPVVAVIGTVGASGGYLTALAADYVLAGETSITGSIGVVFQTVEFSGLLGRLGVGAEAVKSGPLKAEPSPLEPMSEEARAMVQSVVDQTHRWFADLVAERRRLTPEQARAVTDGRIFIGRGALAERLIDGIGGEHEAKRWLAAERQVDADLPVRDVDWHPPAGPLRELLTSTFGKTFATERLILDGLVSLWHPER